MDLVSDQTLLANSQLILDEGMFVAYVSFSSGRITFTLCLAANFVRMLTTNESLAPRANGAIGKVTSCENNFKRDE